jgi:hypothetical protein
MECDSTPGGSHSTGRGRKRTLVLELDVFAWETLDEQSSELGVSVDELVAFSVLYYIADLDSKRIARRLPTNLRAPSSQG